MKEDTTDTDTDDRDGRYHQANFLLQKDIDQNIPTNQLKNIMKVQLKTQTNNPLHQNFNLTKKHQITNPPHPKKFSVQCRLLQGIFLLLWDCLTLVTKKNLLHLVVVTVMALKILNDSNKWDSSCLVEDGKGKHWLL